MKRALPWVGSVLAVAGVIFVAIRLYDYAEEIDVARFQASAWVLVVALSLLYGSANVLLALAWSDLLRFFGAKVTHRWAVRAYGVSQLAKYVPGNVLHLMGRQAVGLDAGIPGWPLAKSILWELGLISFVGALFGVLAIPLFLPIESNFLISASFAGLIALVAIGAHRQFGREVSRAMMLHAAFLAVSALVFLATLALVNAESEFNMAFSSALFGAYVVAWLAGLVTPGAPAGVGVRELVLLFLLSNQVNEADLLLAVVLARLVTMLGDFGFFGFAILTASRWRSGVGSRGEGG